jgi:hypothetical protein
MVDPQTAQGTSTERRATSCSHARFLRNAIAQEPATPSSFESRRPEDGNDCDAHDVVNADVGPGS